MSRSLETQINVPGICDAACLKKLGFLLSQSFTVTHDGSLPAHISYKVELRRVGLQREVHVEIFTNSNISIKASPEILSSFTTVCDEIKAMLKEAIDMLSRQDVVRVNRARRIRDYMSRFLVDEEVERMVIVTLCDVILDLMVTEKLSRFTSRREDLENQSVGAKLGMLEGQHHVPLYRPEAIRIFEV